MDKIDSLIKEYEIKMWEAALASDAAKFLEVVDETAVMVCGGYRCSGKEYADVIAQFNLSGYEIIVYETVLSTDTVVQNHYVVRTVARDGESQEFAGVFHVTSTWTKRNDKWKMIYNMDSQIFEENEKA